MRKWLGIFLFLSQSVFALNSSKISTNLIGGSPSLDYPEIVYITTADGHCSATVIGAEVLLTAGHCVKDGDSITFLSYTAKCESHDKAIHDMALCKVDQKLTIKPAKVDKSAPKVGDKVTLTGYGCIQPGGGLGNDGILRVGNATVVMLPDSFEPSFYTVGTAAICFGDSGGPSFFQGTHNQIGINSRGDIQETSLMTPLWIDKSQEFMKDFAKTQQVEICGITGDCL